MDNHLTIIGMAAVIDGYPLYFDGMNEAGLCAAGLNFPDNADYKPIASGKDNIAPFEVISWILAQCRTLSDARRLLEKMSIADIVFSDSLPLSRLHWMVSDKSGSIVIEQMSDGLHICENPVGVLTNNPPLDHQLQNLANYNQISPDQPSEAFAGKLPVKLYSRGMGGMGLPGDFSSVSRFVKAAFVKLTSPNDLSEEESVTQFFHILSSVEQVMGSVKVDCEKYVITRYSSCCDSKRGIYYYTTYSNSQIAAVDMHNTQLDGSELSVYPLITKQQIFIQC